MLHTSPQTPECNQPCKKKQNGRENTSDEVMQSGFVVISHRYKYRSLWEVSQESWKGSYFPQSRWVYFLFFQFLSTLGIPVICFSVRVTKKWAFQVYPKAPERKWAFPSVGNTVSLCLHYIPAAIESQGGTSPRMVSRISIQSTKKRLNSKWMIGLVSSLRYGAWPAESRVNSHHRCWDQWSMRWYRSSRQVVGWSTCFFPPESDYFCWRPVDKMERREWEESVWTCLRHMDEVIIQSRWQGKSKSI